MKAMNMTEGKPIKLLFAFALPLMLGNVFQQGYVLVDSMIVGQGVGVTALASVGAGDWINWMIIGLIQGFTQGFSVDVAQAYGENNDQRLKKSIYHSYVLSALLIVSVTILSLALLKPLLLLMKTPDNVIGGTLVYLRTMFSGIILITLYNLFACLLRGFGDSKTPLIAMVISSIFNIIMDLVFIYIFHLGIFGAAFATVLSQGLSALICYLSFRKIIKVERKQKIEKEYIRHLFTLGGPISLQNIIISIGGMIVQSVVNGYGLVFIAGFTATNKLYGILEIAGISFGYGICTYVGQNLGAKKIQRIKEGIHVGILFSIVISLTISACMILFGKNIVGLFVESGSTNYRDVVNVAYHYLFIMSIFLPILYFLHLYRNALQGLGNTFIPMVSGFIEFGMRVFAALALPIMMGENGIFYAEILAWTGSMVLLTFSYYREIGRMKK